MPKQNVVVNCLLLKGEKLMYLLFQIPFITRVNETKYKFAFEKNVIDSNVIHPNTFHSELQKYIHFILLY